MSDALTPAPTQWTKSPAAGTSPPHFNAAANPPSASSAVNPALPIGVSASVTKTPWTFAEKLQAWELVFKAGAVIGVALGAIGFYLDYTDKQEKARKETESAAQHARKENEAAAQEREKFTTGQRKTFALEQFKKKMEIYHKLCETTASIATAARREEAAEDIRRFKILYYGSLGLVEDDDVIRCQVAFYRALNAWDQGPPPALDGLSLKLARSCKEHLAFLDEDRRSRFSVEAEEQIMRLVNDHKSRGYVPHPLVKMQNKFLKEKDDCSFSVALEANRKYSFLAGGDRDVDEISMEVLCGKNQVLVATKKPVRDVALPHHSAGEQHCTVRLKLHKSRNSVPCECAVVVMEMPK